MDVTARLRNLRMSPRKVRLVVDLVRGMNAERALEQLTFLNKAATRPVAKLIQSAMANAKHNNKLDPQTLIIKKITADGAGITYRWMPRAHGRATPLRKRSTHLTVVLSDGKVLLDKTSVPAKAPEKSVKAQDEEKKLEAKGADKKPLKKL